MIKAETGWMCLYKEHDEDRALPVEAWDPSGAPLVVYDGRLCVCPAGHRAYIFFDYELCCMVRVPGRKKDNAVRGQIARAVQAAWDCED